MEGNIYITGQIGKDDFSDGVELIDVIQQVKSQPNATSFNVHINSGGGAVHTGFDIYNYLKSIQLPITTIGSEMVASIATVIFMAGNIRILRENTDFMIHLPTGEVGGTADEIHDYAESVKKAEKKLVDFYKDAIQTTTEAITPLLRNETWLSADQAISLGLATEKSLPMVAKAYFNLKPDNKMTQEDKNWLEGLFKPFQNLFKKTISNVILTDGAGTQIDFMEVEEGATPIVGDKAMVDGKPAEGEFLMENGETMIFEKGALTEIKAVEKNDELENANQTIAELQKQLAEAQTVTQNFTNLQKEVVNLKKQIVSKFDFDFQKDVKTENEVTTSRKLLK